MSYFHEEQRFRQWWIWALLGVAAVPLLVAVAIRGAVLPVLVGPLVLLAVGGLLAFARLVVDVDREGITVLNDQRFIRGRQVVVSPAYDTPAGTIWGATARIVAELLEAVQS